MPLDFTPDLPERVLIDVRTEVDRQVEHDVTEFEFDAEEFEAELGERVSEAVTLLLTLAVELVNCGDE